MMIFRKINSLYKAIQGFKRNSKDETMNWVEINPSVTYELAVVPKIIWVYWESSKENLLVELCFDSMRLNCSDFELKVLNKSNISDYVDISVLEQKELKPAIIADFIRLTLLAKYGGVWIDASTYLTENLDWVLNKLKKGSVFTFYSDFCTKTLSRPIIENWFIVAEPNNAFILAWLNEFTNCILSENPYTYYSNFKGNPIIQNIPNTDYLMCYISAAIVMNDNQYSHLMVNAMSVGHHYNYRVRQGWLIAIKLMILKSDNIYIPPLIKFTSHTRKGFNFFLSNRYLAKKSLFGKLIYSKK